MRNIIFYFSGTGNTWYAAGALQKALGLEQTKCISIENSDLTDEYLTDMINKAEQVIIGYPIYGSKAPEPMARFISRLPILERKKPVAVFCTQAFMSGDGANYLEKDLLEKGYYLTQTLELKMSNNFYIPIFIRAFKVGNQEKINKRNAKAVKEINEFAGCIRNRQKSVKVVNWVNQFLGDFQRKEIDKHITKVNEALYADESCIKCGLCVKLCPEKNISLKDKVKFSDGCVACMRCYQACPISAVQITPASKDLNKYPRFKGPTQKFKFTDLQN